MLAARASAGRLALALALLIAAALTPGAHTSDNCNAGNGRSGVVLDEGECARPHDKQNPRKQLIPDRWQLARVLLALTSRSAFARARAKL
jgi:hypothetical protein